MLVCIGVVGCGAKLIFASEICAPALIIALALAGCAVGPNYEREAAPAPTEYKELKGWKLANPRDNVDRGDWWKVYRDPALDTLLPQVEISNQTVAASAAAYEEAKAVIREGASGAVSDGDCRIRRHADPNRRARRNRRAEAPCGVEPRN